MSPRSLADCSDPRTALLFRMGTRAIDGFIFSWMFVSTGALFPLLVSGGTANFNEDTAALLRLLLLPGVIIAPVLIWAKPRQIAVLLGDNLLLVVLLLWIWLSVSWSVDPQISLRRAVLITTNSIVTCYMVISYKLTDIVKMLFWICIVQLTLCIMFAILLPELAFMPDDNRLRGIFTHKSVLGQFLVICTFVFILAHYRRVAPSSIVFVGFLLVMILILPTQSITAVLLVCALVSMSVLLRVSKLRPVVYGIIIFFGLSLIGIVTLMWMLFDDQVMSLLGRDATMTGRTRIWGYMLYYVAERPILGYGYRAFFEDPGHISRIKDIFMFDLTGSHNGFIEMWLDTGIIGLFFTVVFLLTGISRSISRLGRGDDLSSRFAFLWLIVYVGRNMAESDLLSQSHLSWTLTLIAVLLTSRACLAAGQEWRGPGAEYADSRRPR